MKKLFFISVISLASIAISFAQVKVFPSGYVGIMSNTANYTLSLGGSAARTISMERNIIPGNAGPGLTLSSGGAYVGGTNLAGGDLTIKSGISTGTGTSALHFFTATAGSSGTADRTPTEKMTILGNGYVGIGTTSPLLKFDIRGSSTKATTTSFINYFQVASTDASSPLTFQMGIKTDATATNRYGALEVDDAGTKRALVFQPTSGNVGIGTTSPLLKFDVRGTSAKATTTTFTNYLQVASTDASNPLTLRIGIKTDATANNRYGAIEVDDAGVKRKLVLQSAANSTLDIGYVTDTTTAYKLQIHSTTKRGLLCEKTDSSQYSYNLVSKVYGANVKAFTVSYNGNDDRIYMYGNGDMACRNLTEYSDISLKENIAIITSPLTKVLNLRGVTYNFKSEVLQDPTDFLTSIPTGTPKSEMGLIAQEVEQVIPEVVNTDEHGLKSISYSRLVSLLIEAVKEQNQEIQTLKTRLDECCKSTTPGTINH